MKIYENVDVGKFEHFLDCTVIYILLKTHSLPGEILTDSVFVTTDSVFVVGSLLIPLFPTFPAVAVVLCSRFTSFSVLRISVLDFLDSIAASLST